MRKLIEDMYDGEQGELFGISWGINEGFKSLSEKLDDLIPFEGKVPFGRSSIDENYQYLYDHSPEDDYQLFIDTLKVLKKVSVVVIEEYWRTKELIQEYWKTKVSE